VRQLPKLETRFCSASYSEAVSWLANGMALAEPEHKVVVLLSWMYDMPIGEVRRNIKDIWSAQRRSEQNDRDPTGGRSKKRQ
jgi:hypothetical protein